MTAASKRSRLAVAAAQGLISARRKAGAPGEDPSVSAVCRESIAGVCASSERALILLDRHERVLFASGVCNPAEEVDAIRISAGGRWVHGTSEAKRRKPFSDDPALTRAATTAFGGQCYTPRGSATWWDLRPSGNAQAEPTLRLVLVPPDAPLPVQAREAADVAHSQLTAVLESTTDSVVVLDRDWRVTYMNRRAAAMVGSGGKLAVGMNLWDAYPEALSTEFYHNYVYALTTNQPVEFEGYLLPDGMWLEVHAYPSGEGLSIFFRDITEAKRARDQIAHLAHHDALTGLANRFQFNEKLAVFLARVAKGDLAVLLLDLDAFKDVNDSLGHPVGDALLQKIAGRLRAVADRTGLFARLGGDEFAIIQPVSPTAPDPKQLAERLIACLDEPFEIDVHIIRVGVSIGIAISSEAGSTPDDLLKAADIALYRAKADGRGRYRLYEPGMHEQLEARQALKQDLVLALTNGELVLEYQPLVDLRTGRVRSCEALLRWHHPVRGLVPPSGFIPIAEETGLIESFGAWVLAEACRAAQGWPGDIGVSVNLSPVQFKDKDLPAIIACALAQSGLETKRLTLEITEKLLLHHTDHNLDIMRRISNFGVKFALDDFGTGFSSLSYLRIFPFETIKIDGSFIAELGSVNQSEAIVRAIIGLAKSLGVKVLAEGVETQAQLRWLRHNGCQRAQGYLFSRPLAGDEMRQFLARPPVAALARICGSMPLEG